MDRLHGQHNFMRDSGLWALAVHNRARDTRSQPNTLTARWEDVFIYYGRSVRPRFMMKNREKKLGAKDASTAQSVLFLLVPCNLYTVAFQ